MNRRDLIALIGGAAAWSVAARAQQLVVRRVGVLMGGVATDAQGRAWVAAFGEGLRQAGWTEGQNLRIDVRWNGADAELARTYAAQLIGLMPDVILADTTINLTVIQQATITVPVVFLRVSDPVAQGFVTSVRQPGGDITGFSSYEFAIGGKWLDLVKQVAPSLSRVAVMFHPEESPQSKFFMQAVEAAAPSFGVEVIGMPVRAIAEIEPALERFARRANGGLILPTGGFTQLNYKLIADLAVHNRLTSISSQSGYAKQGGLMDYDATINWVSQFRQASIYVDRILRGAKPGDLPIQQPEKYTLAINLQTAKALGLTLPSGLLASADEVIE